MSRKRIWYWIEPRINGSVSLWWVPGLKEPVPMDHPARKAKGGSSKRNAYTMKQALRIARRCLAGAEIVRFMNVHGKRPRRYQLLTFEMGAGRAR